MPHKMILGYGKSIGRQQAQTPWGSCTHCSVSSHKLEQITGCVLIHETRDSADVVVRLDNLGQRHSPLSMCARIAMDIEKLLKGVLS